MLVAGLLFGCMGVFVRLGAAHFSYIELVFYRSFFGLLLVYGIMRHQHIRVATQHCFNHMARPPVRGPRAVLLPSPCCRSPPPSRSTICAAVLPPHHAGVQDRFHLPLTIAIGLGCGVVLLLQQTQQKPAARPARPDLRLLAGVASQHDPRDDRRPDTRTVLIGLIASLGTACGCCSTPCMQSPQGFAIPLGLQLRRLAQLAMTRTYRTGRTLVVGSPPTTSFASLFGIRCGMRPELPSSWLAFIIASSV
jgi:hypothetical protein